MKKVYIKPETETMFLFTEGLMKSNSEEEWGSWIGGKENEDVFFDDAPFGSLWDDNEPAKDPFAIGD